MVAKNANGAKDGLKANAFLNNNPDSISIDSYAAYSSVAEKKKKNLKAGNRIIIVDDDVDFTEYPLHHVNGLC